MFHSFILFAMCWYSGLPLVFKSCMSFADGLDVLHSMKVHLFLYFRNGCIPSIPR